MTLPYMQSEVVLGIRNVKYASTKVRIWLQDSTFRAPLTVLQAAGSFILFDS